MSANISRTYGYLWDVREVEEPQCYLETEEFESYVRQVQAVIETRGIATTGDIHRALGYDRQHMTLDALEALDVDQIGVQPVRYTMRDRHIKELTLKDHNARPFALNKYKRVRRPF